MTPTEFTGVILAGGASRRMGTDKAQLTDQNGDPFLDIMRRILLTTGAHNVVILGRSSVKGGVADNCSFAGPVQAITDYLENCPSGSKHLIVPLDMPNLTATLLHTLITSGPWAHFIGYNMPFAVTAGASIPNDVSRVKDLLASQHATKLKVPSGQEGAFVNLNYPQEFIRWQGQCSSGEYQAITAHLGTKRRGYRYA